MYTEGNPVNYTDPSGHITREEANEAQNIVSLLKTNYQINIDVDWGDNSWNYWWIDPVDSAKNGVQTVCSWKLGNWKIEELRSVQRSVRIMSIGIHWSFGGSFTYLAGSVQIKRGTGDRSFASGNQIYLENDIKNSTRRPAIIVHEMGHIITNNRHETMYFYMGYLNTDCIDGGSNGGVTYCNEEQKIGTYNPGIYAGSDYKYLPSSYASVGNWEDFAETFTVVVSDSYIASGDLASRSEAMMISEQNGYNHDIGRRRTVMQNILKAPALQYHIR